MSDFDITLSNMLRTESLWRVKSLRYVFLIKSELLNEVDLPDGLENNDSFEDILFEKLILKGELN
jgi:hypothetical protein